MNSSGDHRVTSLLTWRGYVLVAAGAGVVAAFVSLAVVFLIGPRLGHPVAPAATMVEDDVAEVALRGDSRKGETKVFYRNPFASPPKLTFPGGLADGVFVLEQTAEGFKLGRDVTGYSGYLTVAKVTWRAEGVRAR
jgi:hypothetical protein